MTQSLFGNRGETTIDALIDTGFDGALCVPIPIAIPLGLELYGDHTYELADGTIKQELTYRAIVHLGEETCRIEVILTESEDALLGSELLEGYVLEIDYGNRTIEIRKSLGNA
ncbi:clan AA aspartic protease [Candidatus Poribacteria bacterium]|nr:clan AA aspartic protease [Candidatus Poribacteria bacterium]